MFAYMMGKLADKSPTSIVVEANGIGYQITISLTTHHQLPSVGSHVKLLLHFVVREDIQQLYGFYTEEERNLFRLLLGVSGVGPKMAMMVLSGLELRELKQAIVDGAVPVLSAISGIGRKTAERIIVELREKIVVDGTSVKTHARFPAQDALTADGLQALVSLGYKKQAAKDAIQKVLSMQTGKEKMKVEELIRHSLKYV